MPDTTNAPEFSVSELAGAIKRTVEQTFGRVRVRGELGRVTIARSGHCYLDLKDDKAVINSIIWKGTMNKLRLVPEEGMEVIVEGRMSTYPGRSNYQLVIEKLELAGAGALMALLDKRRKALAAEGLFASENKVDLPFLPKVIGVVTSPTGAVIRDILHRIGDRFPVRVILWPVTVQGEGSAEKIAAAITGFNNYEPTAHLPRPDVLIVGRGGGSVEDLWCFNEEVVVRAAAASAIPLISAVGHETDTTLIDYASDYRAPTPTGAAEVAVPVRAELALGLEESGQRMARALRRNAQESETRLRAARLPRAERLLESAALRLDGLRFPKPDDLLARQRQMLQTLAARLPTPRARLDGLAARLTGLRLPPPDRMIRDKTRELEVRTSRLAPALRATTARLERRLDAGRRLRPALITDRAMRQAERVTALDARLARAAQIRLQSDADRLARAGSLLDAFSYQDVLARGFALVTDGDGQVVRSRDSVESGERIHLEFSDGTRKATIDGHGAARASRKRVVDARPTGQRELF